MALDGYYAALSSTGLVPTILKSVNIVVSMTCHRQALGDLQNVNQFRQISNLFQYEVDVSYSK
jgi:hypothetical protein